MGVASGVAGVMLGEGARAFRTMIDDEVFTHGPFLVDFKSIHLSLPGRCYRCAVAARLA